MIEVNLYSIPAQEMNSMVGRCVARSRFDKEGMGAVSYTHLTLPTT